MLKPDALPQTIATRRGDLAVPSFLPDATLGAVRSVDAADLRAVGIRALVMNIFHLMQKPGSSTVQALGGLHRFSGWDGPILTDSGGFQAYSLIRNNPKLGALSDQGITFLPEGAERKFQLTPEKCVQLQLAYGSDIVICLDDCTHVDDDAAAQQTAVTRTVRWAKRCRAEFDLQLRQRKNDTGRPLLFGVVQGGGDPALRRQCAEQLLEIGFDGYGYGGWPLDSKGKLLTELLQLTRELIPRALPLHALGIGAPDNIAACARIGYTTFDSALPTRDARSGRLYAFTRNPDQPGFAPAGHWYETIYIEDKKHIKADAPIDPTCDCSTCQRYSLAYLHHLHKVSETGGLRLATIHNLRFIVRLMTALGAV